MLQYLTPYACPRFRKCNKSNVKVHSVHEHSTPWFQALLIIWSCKPPNHVVTNSLFLYTIEPKALSIPIILSRLGFSLPTQLIHTLGGPSFPIQWLGRGLALPHPSIYILIQCLCHLTNNLYRLVKRLTAMCHSTPYTYAKLTNHVIRQHQSQATIRLIIKVLWLIHKSGLGPADYIRGPIPPPNHFKSELA